MSEEKSSRCGVLLIGFEAQENLGLRSLGAFLQRAGIQVGIQPMQGASNDTILRRVEEAQPKLVGFSLIFQRMLDHYANLIGHLRSHGVKSHFTMGGHFPSFQFADVLGAIPGLDSIVLFEGEQTLLELFTNLDQAEAWQKVMGLAYRDGQTVRTTGVRPLIDDLDALPFPLRGANGANHRGAGIRSIAGSRGCYYGCSFCSISEFYSRAPGPARRTRSPQGVVREMLELRDRSGAKIYIFQDDDLFMRSRKHRAWLDQFLGELERAGLAGSILWRISCRVDDLDLAYLQRMKAAGLVSVYLGIESACDAELLSLNKGYKAKAVYEAVDLLREAGMPFEFGFMIFTPDSSLNTVAENLQFLDHIRQHTNSLVHFCKTAPYAGTAIQQRLQREGRLEGSLACPDYRFLDPKLDLLQTFFSQTFNRRNFDDQGLVERLRFAKFDTCVLRRLGSRGYDVDRYENSVNALIRASNDSALDAMTFALNLICQNSEEKILEHWDILEEVRQHECSAEREITARLDALLADHGFFEQCDG